MAKRQYGSGSLFVVGSAGYGQWRVAGKLTKRRLGAVRTGSSAVGLSRKDAEVALRELMVRTAASPVGERITFVDAARRHVEHVEEGGTKLGSPWPGRTRHAAPRTSAWGATGVLDWLEVNECGADKPALVLRRSPSVARGTMQ